MPATAVPFRASLITRRRSGGSTILPVPSAPDTPSAPSPADTAETRYTLLSWVSARATRFDIYLSTSNPPTVLVPKYVGTSYVPTLLPSATYYWQIVAFNDGGSATGPIWSFRTPSATKPFITVAGSLVSNVRAGSIRLQDVRGAAPNTGTLTFDTTAPTVGQAIQIGLGSLDADALIFGGELQSQENTYVDHPNSGLWPVSLVDHVFALNRRRPFGTWTDTSATVIVQYLIATFAPSFTATGVEADLSDISITFDGSEDLGAALQRIATAVGGYFKVGYDKNIHLRVLADTDDAPDPVDTNHPPLNTPTPAVFTTDLSQIRTRVYGKGHAETVPCDVAVGEWIVPIVDAVQFNVAGGQAIAGTTADGAQSEIMTYASLQQAGGGSLVGPGASPSTAPALTLVQSTGLGDGVYTYAYTASTASGESLPSPLATVTTLAGGIALTDPASAPTFGFINSSQPFTHIPAGTYLYAVTFVNAHGEETLPSPTFSQTLSLGGQYYDVFLVAPVGPVGTTSRRYYRTINGGSQLKFVGTLAGNVGGAGLQDSTHDADLGVNAPTVNNTGPHEQVSVGSIAIGASPTISRTVYRTVVGGSQLKLLHVLADNTTTTYLDSTADGSLGANPPVFDLSGLAQPDGQVLAGSTSLLTASPSPFSTSGGWVQLSAGQTVRYTGISGNTLTGVPVSGPGAITTTVLYGSQALPAPALVGVNSYNGLRRAMSKGATVAIWVQRDVTDAQITLGQLELDEDGNATDGIHQFLIVDGRRGEDSLTALCDADLAQFGRPIVSVAYYTRDTKSRAGKTVAVNLPTVGPVGDYVIQRVETSFDGPERPLYYVLASSSTFSLDNLLRRVQLSD